MPAAREAVPGENDRMAVVRQHVHNLLLEGSPGHFHRLSGKLVYPLFASVAPNDRTATGDVEAEVFGASLHEAVHLATPKRGISFSDRGFRRNRFAGSYLALTSHSRA
jgi:hypothetical protein